MTPRSLSYGQRGRLIRSSPLAKSLRKPREKPHFHGWRIGLAWHDIRFAVLTYSLEYPEPPMGEVVRFIPRSELERARLIREARVIYEHIFPPADQANKRPDPDK